MGVENVACLPSLLRRNFGEGKGQFLGPPTWRRRGEQGTTVIRITTGDLHQHNLLLPGS
jgi:hypothetical protein